MWHNLAELQAEAQARADEAAWSGDLEKARRFDGMVAKYAARIAAGETREPSF